MSGCRMVPTRKDIDPEARIAGPLRVLHSQDSRSALRPCQTPAGHSGTSRTLAEGIRHAAPDIAQIEWFSVLVSYDTLAAAE